MSHVKKEIEKFSSQVPCESYIIGFRINPTFENAIVAMTSTRGIYRVIRARVREPEGERKREGCAEDRQRW